MNAVLLIGLILVSYLVGSISFGRILSAKEKTDITRTGSGSPGATNMLRTYGAKLGLLTLLFDLIKGIVPALVGYFAFGGAGNMAESYIGLYACGLSAVIGHIFPIYYRFHGGKAAATACGVFLVAQPVVALIAFVVCVGLAFIIKYVSPMSLLFILINVVWQCLFMPEFNFMPATDPALILLVVAIGVAVYVAHWQNIARLIHGKENKTDLWAKITEKIGKKSSGGGAEIPTNQEDKPEIPVDKDDKTKTSMDKDDKTEHNNTKEIKTNSSANEKQETKLDEEKEAELDKEENVEVQNDIDNNKEAEFDKDKESNLDREEDASLNKEKDKDTKE